MKSDPDMRGKAVERLKKRLQRDHSCAHTCEFVATWWEGKGEMDLRKSGGVTDSIGWDVWGGGGGQSPVRNSTSCWG